MVTHNHTDTKRCLKCDAVFQMVTKALRNMRTCPHCGGQLSEPVKAGKPT